eukprot:Platyproteum_vivax@DN1452_c0_g1_i1.p1
MYSFAPSDELFAPYRRKVKKPSLPLNFRNPSLHRNGVQSCDMMVVGTSAKIMKNSNSKTLPKIDRKRYGSKIPDCDLSPPAPTAMRMPVNRFNRIPLLPPIKHAPKVERRRLSTSIEGRSWYVVPSNRPSAPVTCIADDYRRLRTEEPPSLHEHNHEAFTDSNHHWAKTAPKTDSLTVVPQEATWNSVLSRLAKTSKPKKPDKVEKPQPKPPPKRPVKKPIVSGYSFSRPFVKKQPSLNTVRVKKSVVHWPVLCKVDLNPIEQAFLDSVKLSLTTKKKPLSTMQKNVRRLRRDCKVDRSLQDLPLARRFRDLEHVRNTTDLARFIYLAKQKDCAWTDIAVPTGGQICVRIQPNTLAKLKIQDKLETTNPSTSESSRVGTSSQVDTVKMEDEHLAEPSKPSILVAARRSASRRRARAKSVGLGGRRLVRQSSSNLTGANVASNNPLVVLEEPWRRKDRLPKCFWATDLEPFIRCLKFSPAKLRSHPLLTLLQNVTRRNPKVKKEKSEEPPK